jgi:hypothetical protein
MINSIPPLLYRGDADRYNIRDLKRTLDYQQLQTNLLKGGVGHEVFTKPILDLVGEHVDPGWALSHFLSFSEDRTTALRFGLGCEYEEAEDQMMRCIEHDEDEINWDFAIIAVDTRTIIWNQIGDGIYKVIYEPGLLKFKEYPGHAKVILIDVVRAMNNYQSHPNYAKILENANRDKEWLLLPASKMIMNTGVIQYSGIMDGSCISEIVKYKILNY